MLQVYSVVTVYKASNALLKEVCSREVKKRIMTKAGGMWKMCKFLAHSSQYYISVTLTRSGTGHKIQPDAVRYTIQ